jgi:hypothetical protein
MAMAAVGIRPLEKIVPNLMSASLVFVSMESVAVRLAMGPAALVGQGAYAPHMKRIAIQKRNVPACALVMGLAHVLRRRVCLPAAGPMNVSQRSVAAVYVRQIFLKSLCLSMLICTL